MRALLEPAIAKDAAIPMSVQMKLLKFSKAAIEPLVPCCCFVVYQAK